MVTVLREKKWNLGEVGILHFNGLLTQLNLNIDLTEKQLIAIEKSFQEEDGITERSYRLRKEGKETETNRVGLMVWKKG